MWLKYKIHNNHGIFFLNRSVKNLNLAALSVMQNLPVLQGCEIEVFNGSSFFILFLNAESGINIPRYEYLGSPHGG